MTRINKTPWLITIAFMVFVAAFNVNTLYHIDQIYAGFVTNDWLINYEGGFVRRGLSGQLLLYAANLTHVPLWLLVFGVRASMYVGIAVLAIRKLPGRLSLAGWIFLVSPVTFLFEVYDPGGAGRKELLFLLFLAMHSLMLERKAAQALPLRPAYYAGVTVFLVTGILVHETFLFYVPLYLLQLASHGRLRQSKLLAVPLLASLLAFGAVSARKGSAATVEQILQSLRPFVPNIGCDTNGGAICYLSSTTADALRYVFVPEIGQLLLIPVMILLGYSALFLSSLNRAQPAGSMRDTPWLLILALLSLAPLFAVAVDYGRWLHVFVLGLFFALPRSVLLREEGAGAAPADRIVCVLAVLFSLSWSIIHTRAASFQPGALGIAVSHIPVERLIVPPPATGPAASPAAAPTHFAAVGAVFRWKGCELLTVIGTPTAACGIEKRAPSLAGHLTYGPYEPLPAGDYTVEIKYVSAQPRDTTAGAWDVAVRQKDGIVVMQGQLQGSEGTPAVMSGTFTIESAQDMQLVEIRTAAYAGTSLRIDSIELRRTR